MTKTDGGISVLEYYVLNEDFNSRKIVRFNIFQNWRLEEETIKEIKKYIRSPKKYEYVPFNKEKETLYGFDGFCEELRHLIMWQEWGRCEYEISVGSLFTEELRDVVYKVDRGELKEEEVYEYIKEGAERNSNLEKWDCYMQCEKNIPMIAREVIYQYKQSLRENGNDA